MEIATEELPEIYHAIGVDEAAGANIPPEALEFRARLREAMPIPNKISTLPANSVNPHALERAFDACRIGEEEPHKELGSDRLTETAAQTAALLSGSLGSAASKAGFLRHTLRLAHGITLAVYALAFLTSHGGKRSVTRRTIEAVVFILGGVFFGLAFVLDRAVLPVCSRRVSIRRWCTC